MSARYAIGLLAVLFFNVWAWVGLAGISAMADCTALVWLAAVMGATSAVALGAHIVEVFK